MCGLEYEYINNILQLIYYHNMPVKTSGIESFSRRTEIYTVLKPIYCYTVHTGYNRVNFNQKVREIVHKTLCISLHEQDSYIKVTLYLLLFPFERLALHKAVKIFC